jgi:Fe-S cluster biogenesis protein NfuA
MQENKDFQAKNFQVKFQRIAELVAGLENIEDAEARAAAKALLQLLLDLHAFGMERALEIVAASGEVGQRSIDELGRDPVVSSLLVLYNLHPLDLETRVVLAVERVRPHVRKAGGEVDLLGVEAGVVRLRLQITGHACGSTKSTIRSMVEDALYEAAPDALRLQIEGIEDPAGAAGFVPLGKVSAAPALTAVLTGTGL